MPKYHFTMQVTCTVAVEASSWEEAQDIANETDIFQEHVKIDYPEDGWAPEED